MILQSIHNCPQCGRSMLYDNSRYVLICKGCGIEYVYSEWSAARKGGWQPRINEATARDRAGMEDVTESAEREYRFSKMVAEIERPFSLRYGFESIMCRCVEVPVMAKHDKDKPRGCLGCGRDVKIVAKGLGWCCYPLLKKFKGDISKLQEFRKKTPVIDRKHGIIKGSRRERVEAEPAADKPEVDPGSKWLSGEIDKQIENLVETIKRRSGKIVKIEAEIKMEIVSFKVVK